MPRPAFAVALWLAATCAVTAADKPPTFDQAIRHTPAGMATDAAVQEELKLTAEQVTAVGKALAAEGEKFAAGWKALGDEPKAAAVGKLVAETCAAANAAADKVLTDAQRKRLRQLELQARGPAAFDDPEVQKALGGVTDEQRKKWAAAKDDYERRLGKLRREAGGVDTFRRIPGTDIPAAGQEVLGEKTLLQLRREQALVAKNVLTNDQLNRWYELIGDVFPNPEKKRR